MSKLICAFCLLWSASQLDTAPIANYFGPSVSSVIWSARSALSFDTVMPALSRHDRR